MASRRFRQEVPWDERLINVPAIFLKCRAARRHLMEPVGDIITEGSQRNPLAIKRTLRCSLCDTRRVVEMNVVRWEIIRSYYDHPDGYKIAGETIDPRALTRELWLSTAPDPDVFGALAAVRPNGNGKR
jgi:hypothetical protein